jgi:hypothetical protein
MYYQRAGQVGSWEGTPPSGESRIGDAVSGRPHAGLPSTPSCVRQGSSVKKMKGPKFFLMLTMLQQVMGWACPGMMCQADHCARGRNGHGRH